jgi:hypothetical protein
MKIRSEVIGKKTVGQLQSYFRATFEIKFLFNAILFVAVSLLGDIFHP